MPVTSQPPNPAVVAAFQQALANPAGAVQALAPDEPQQSEPP